MALIEIELGWKGEFDLQMTSDKRQFQSCGYLAWGTIKPTNAMLCNTLKGECKCKIISKLLEANLFNFRELNRDCSILMGSPTSLPARADPAKVNWGNYPPPSPSPLRTEINLKKFLCQ